jgi:membrane-associated phospholipid phosphatase
MFDRISAIRPWTSQFAARRPRAYLGLNILLGLLVSAVCAWLYYAIADTILSRGHMVRFDHRVARWVDLHNTDSGKSVATVVSLFGNQLMWVIAGLAALACLLRRRRQRALLIGVAVIGGALLNQALKDRFHRGRPIFSAQLAVDSSSFPSGHAMGSMIGYGILAYVATRRLQSPRRRRAIFAVAAAMIVLIGFTRIYLDAHFVSDVLAGYAAGGMWLFVCISGYRFAHLDRAGK